MKALALPFVLAQTPGSPGLVQFVPLILILGIFYFLLIAPMRKRQKALQAMIANLAKGDRVVTTGGLYGEVVALHEDHLIVRIADDVKVKIARSAISGMEGQEEPK